MRIGIVIILLLCFRVGAQHPADYIQTTNFNKQYLEHLIKIRVDSVREAHGLRTLANDSILYVAAVGHADYLVEKRKLSHYQSENKDTKTPQLRAEWHGAVNYLVGENIARTYIHKPLRGKKKSDQYEITSYGKLAHEFVKMWVESPGHYANMINPDYEVTGVAVEWDSSRNEVKAVQKFAQILFQYSFPENKEMFPYSNYVPPAQPSRLNEISHERLVFKYPYKLRAPEDSMEICGHCNAVIDTNMYKDRLIVKGRRVIFTTPNVEMMYEILNHRKNGLALEIVEYTPVDCGNSDYYNMPSRRNNQSLLNGTIQEPLYRKDLIHGFKRGRYKWFYRLKKRGKPTHFEITLGRLPRDAQGYVEANVLVIQKKKICRVMHLSNVCGEELDALYDVSYLTELNTYNYAINPSERTIKFKVPFEQGKYRYDYEDIQPLIDSVTSDNFTVLWAKINAYSSLEGSRELNESLQKRRAKSIVEALEDNQKSAIESEIHTAENWEVFEKQVDKYRALVAYKGLDKDQVRAKINGGSEAKRIEQFLSQQRYGEIKLRISEDVSEEGLDRYLVNEFNRHFDSVVTDIEKVGMTSAALSRIDSMAGIQWYTYRAIKQGRIDTVVFEELKVPMQVDFKQIIKDRLWYELDLFSGAKDGRWERDFYYRLTKLDRIGISSYEMRFDVLNYLVRHWRRRPPPAKEIDNLRAGITGLVSNAPSKELRESAEKLLANFYVNLAAHTHFSKPTRDDNVMRASMEWLLEYFNDSITAPEVIYQLGSFFTWGEQEDLAYYMLAPSIKRGVFTEEILVLYCKLLFAHFEEYPESDYADLLIEARSLLPQKKWCEMFVGPCNISFQIFDHERLRDLYCTECAKYPNYAESPEEWED